MTEITKEYLEHIVFNPKIRDLSCMFYWGRTHEGTDYWIGVDAVQTRTGQLTPEAHKIVQEMMRVADPTIALQERISTLEQALRKIETLEGMGELFINEALLTIIDRVQDIAHAALEASHD